MQVTLSDTILRNLIKNRDGNRVSLTDSKTKGLSVEVRRASATFYLRTA